MHHILQSCSLTMCFANNFVMQECTGGGREVLSSIFLFGKRRELTRGDKYVDVHGIVNCPFCLLNLVVAKLCSESTLSI